MISSTPAGYPETMQQLLVCTDLDRTLLPNGAEPESPGAREYFAALIASDEISLAYVSGRHRALVEEAIEAYHLPWPDFVIGDVGTTIYEIDSKHDWKLCTDWEQFISHDWNGQRHDGLARILEGIDTLQLQPEDRQNSFKLSYFAPLNCDRETLSAVIQQRLTQADIKANLIWSIDEPAATSLLDILPAQASKYHAIEALQQRQGFDNHHTVFSGDSGNDIEVLASPIPSVLVANSQPDVRQQADRLARAQGLSEQLYIARGGFLGMNGNYSAGILEGIAHYHPWILDYLTGEEAMTPR